MKKSVLIALILAFVMTATIVLAIILKRDNNSDNNNPTPQVETHQDEESEKPVLITNENFIVPSDILVTIDEEDAIIDYQLPTNCKISPTFSIESGTCITLVGRNISPTDYGTAVIKAVADTVTKHISVTVLKIELNIEDNLRCGAKADGTFDTHTLTVLSNYALSDFNIIGTGTKNITFKSQSVDRKTIVYEFQLTQCDSNIKFTCYDQTITKGITSTAYISNCNYSLSNNLEKDVNGNYILYRINNQIYETTALSDNKPCFTNIVINNPSQFVISSDNTAILAVSGNKISAVNIGATTLTITANDGSQYSEKIKFIVKDTYANIILTTKDSVELKIESFKQCQLTISYLPVYATSTVITSQFDNSIIDYNNSTITAKTVGSTTLEFFINGVSKKQIPVVVKDEFHLVLVNNITQVEITDMQISINLLESDQLSLIYLIQNHKNQASINQTLDIIFEDENNIASNIETTDRVYAKLNKTGQFQITMKNAELGINETLTVIVN